MSWGLVTEKLSGLYPPTEPLESGAVPHLRSQFDPLKPLRIVAFLDCGDAGGDELKSRALIASAVATCLHQVCIPVDCQMRQYQLMVKKRCWCYHG